MALIYAFRQNIYFGKLIFWELTFWELTLWEKPYALSSSVNQTDFSLDTTVSELLCFALFLSYDLGHRVFLCLILACAFYYYCLK